MDREALWWAQAGPSSVLGKIALAVSRKERVVCISTPTPRMSGLTAAIERRLRTELSLDSVSIDLTAEDQSQPIAHMLAGFLDVSAVEIGTVAEFAVHPSLVDRVMIVDGLDRTQLRRWSLFLRQLMAEPPEETVVGPVLLVLLPTGLDRDDRSTLCGPVPLVSTQGMCDRYDSASYAAAIGARPAQGLTSRVGHAAAIEVAAWSRELLEETVGWDAADQIAPFPLLDRLVARRQYPFPCWENGLVDYWDDEPAAHAVAALQHGHVDHVRRRVWSAQASVLLPFTHRVLRSLISRYQHVLARKVSPAKPYVRKIHDHVKTIDDFWKLEFYDLKEFTKDLLSPNEANLLGQAGWIRNKVAHFDLIEPEVVSRFSDYYEATIGDVDFDIPGWNWPRCGQSMTLTVGPSGAGKSTWSAAQGVDVVSSDEIRKERSPDGEVRGAQSEIFHEVRMRSAKTLGDGRSVIVDAMHIEADDRLRQLAIAPADVQKRYALIDRPLADKQRDGGWRGQKGLVDKYHRLFADQADAALAADGRDDVEVIDLRIREGKQAAE
ncbi:MULTISPECIES: AAA family ATPase [Bradyrhizobium]|jgi:predicted kinase|uniref:Kinase n=4 Tax=Bradyrhizobium elkanii TaxID=29448 RepID=A0ABV4EQB7_BRAEL|nr:MULTISPECIES: AAA family ATPase [Bradyrhizobium]MCP1758705.1 putative kinase [Bradyrhizobium elkanii]MCP1975724.1 putative kinase [Bradyrhizobium elkanii]MCP1984902.1 putative kinase [Bradyrhizobium elkanii]MCS3890744.1 putative kinase [Bradyrhizobium elkanii]MCS4113072.1 putative kinase [Bradyrhizobium elkanii]